MLNKKKPNFSTEMSNWTIPCIFDNVYDREKKNHLYMKMLEKKSVLKNLMHVFFHFSTMEI